VQYNAIATTRYREYFPAELTKQVDLITVEGPKASVVNIPSSARPLPPKVVYIVPTFKWDSSSDKLTSTRVGRGLRIYLERPWYSSGDDELLGIIIAPDATSSADLRKKYMSEWGADPVFSSAGPSATIKVSDFVDDGVDPITKPTVGTGLALAELPTSGLTVTAVGYQPQYNDQRQLWYVDVEMDPGSSYYPFIRFALARYQPYSVENLHLSHVVRTEFAQLVADRTATIGYARGAIDVTVSGFASRNQLGAELPLPAPPPIVGPVAPAPLGPVTRRTLATTEPGNSTPGPAGPGPIVNPPSVGIFVSDPYAGAGRLVRARVERLDNPASPDLGWTQVSAEVVLPPFTILFAPTEVYWRGSVPTPSGFGTDGKTYRLVVHEVELFETDDEVQETDLPVFAAGRVIRERPVYFDTFPLAP
jgi:hypothetical protein